MSSENKTKKINVLIVDDHPIYRDGIRNIVRKIDIVKLCDEAGNGQLAIEMMEKIHYDIVFLDIEMPVMDGIEASSIMKKKFPESKIVVLTMSDSRKQIVEMLENGVQGYILKNTDAKELTRAIQLIMEGTLYLTPEVKDTWSRYLVDKTTFEKYDSHHIDLTERQKKIIFHLCQQLTASEIADTLFLSVSTVNNHRAQIMKKLKIKNGIGLALYAVKAGIYPI
jgi:two-component system response regulator DegU